MTRFDYDLFSMIIGIPKETKKKEYRVALIPRHVEILVNDGHVVKVESDAGLVSGFSDEEYKRVGAIIEDDVWNSEMIVKVKEPEISNLKKNQIIMGYLHIEKNQSPKLLKALLEKNITSYAFEEFRDQWQERLVNLGFEAGLVGMYEGLRKYGEMKNISELKNLKSIWEIGLRDACAHLLNLDLYGKFLVGVMGNGKVSFGTQEILRRCGIGWRLLDRTKTEDIESYLHDLDILINAVVWKPGNPHIITKDTLSYMKKGSLIVDISCDKGGAIKTCIPTSWKDPCYEKEGIVHMCIDNLPSAIPREASIHLSHMIFPYVRSVAKGECFRSALMTKNKKLMYVPKVIERDTLQQELRLSKDPLFDLI